MTKSALGFFWVTSQKKSRFGAPGDLSSLARFARSVSPPRPQLRLRRNWVTSQFLGDKSALLQKHLQYTQVTDDDFSALCRTSS